MLQKWCNWALLVLFGGVLVVVPVLTLALPKQTVSYYENRALADTPVLSLQGLVHGQYFADWETWLSDHIAGRNTILRTHTRILRALPKVEANNIIETESGALVIMAAPEDYDPEKQAQIMNKKADALKQLIGQVEDYGGVFAYVGVPAQRYVYYDAYPEYLKIGHSMVDYNEKRVFSALAETNAAAVDVCQLLREANNPEQYYSAMDNHYNYKGVLLTYHALMQALNTKLDTPLKEYQDTELTFHTEKQDFFGTYNSRICNLQALKEHLVWAEPTEPVPFTRTDNGEAVPADTFRQPDSAVSAYAGYMSGDIGETIIRTGRDDLPRVLVFGDSFTNPLEGLLYASCGEMRSLDLRNYDKMTLCDYIDQYQPDLVIAVRDNMSFDQFTGNGNYTEITAED